MQINDVMSFTSAIARAQFTDCQTWTPEQAIKTLREPYSRALEYLTDVYADRLAQEAIAVGKNPEALAHFVENAEHVGASSEYVARAAAASKSRGLTRHQLTTLYFASSYFSTRQAIELDAIRYAIARTPGDTSQLIAAWLAVGSLIANSPGHTAQFLRPHSPQSAARIIRHWKRSPWDEYAGRTAAVKPIGSRSWRRQNSVTTMDALRAVESGLRADVRVAYADPPYTKDHYSRYYHVLETMYKYDFPESAGAGRYPAGRFQSAFSVTSKAEKAFRTLFEGVAREKLPLVLSYPDDGLLARSGIAARSLLQDYFTIRAEHAMNYRHSTLGASTGSPTKDAIERVYVCVP